MTTSSFALGNAQWIWAAGFDDAATKGQFVLFRRAFNIEQKPTDDILLNVSADTRYRLYLNGESISFGPCKSYLTRWFYETVNITPHLRDGLNVLAAKVLRFSSSHDGNLNMIRSPHPGFILHCPALDISTDRSWKGLKDNATKLQDDSAWDFRLGPQFLSLSEDVDGRFLAQNWQGIEYDDRAWSFATRSVPQRKMSPMLDARRLFPREIPMLPEVRTRFDKTVDSSSLIPAQVWNDLLHNDTPLQIPSNSQEWVELETSVLTTGFLDLTCTFSGLAEEAATIQILCSECYESSMEEGAPRTKGDRTDYQNGRLYGLIDTYRPHQGSNHYSPFWFRTFRYIRLTVTTKGSPIILNSFTFRSTHYPLNVGTSVQTSSPPLVRKLWDISVNTLKNCMHETYEDCPFYEQNQFAMDTRSQILFTYLLSRDDRLARKSMQEFYASRRDDGLVETHFPSPGRSINIPTFSLFWVLMIYDHMVYFGDEKLIKRYIGAVDGVLDYFDGRLDERGLVGQFDADCWAFVDWVDVWCTPSRGFTGLAVPRTYYESGAATYHSLIYAYTLLKASELQTFLGRHDTAREYLNRHNAINTAVQSHCYDAATGFFLDGPGAFDQKSQHVQILAVLSGLVGGKEAEELMRRTILQPQDHGLAKASLAMGFYLFRAASKAGVYAECWDALIQPWRRMISQNLTTWSESESMVRSDCHGWSAVPIWEIVTEILGVKQGSREYLRRVKGILDGGEVQFAPKKGLVDEIDAKVLVARRGKDGSSTLHIQWGKSAPLATFTYE